MAVLFHCKYQDKGLLNHNDVKNEVFTENFFEGLTQVKSVMNSSCISKWDDLKEMCHALGHLSLKESNYESDLNYYGGYSYMLQYENGREKRLSFMGISDNRTLIYVENACYETEEVIIPQIVALFGGTEKEFAN